jgi:excisionase family DNA binding protein
MFNNLKQKFMEVTVIESSAIQHIDSRLDKIEKYLKHIVDKQPLEDVWLDLEEACLLLKVSKRTLQNYRDDGILTYSQVGGKIYFPASAIDEHLKNHLRKAFKKPEKYL